MLSMQMMLHSNARPELTTKRLYSRCPASPSIVLGLIHVDNMARGDSHTRDKKQHERREASHRSLHMRRGKRHTGVCGGSVGGGHARVTSERRQAIHCIPILHARRGSRIVASTVEASQIERVQPVMIMTSQHFWSIPSTLCG